VILDNRREHVLEDIFLDARARLDKEFERILGERSELLKELFEVGIASRTNLDSDAPAEVKAEQVRKEMETLASDLEVQLSSLPRKYAKTHRKLRSLASRCNRLGSRYFRLEAMAKDRFG